MRFGVAFIFILTSFTAFSQQKFEVKGTISPAVKIEKLFFTRIKMYGETKKPEAMAVSVKDGKFLIKGELTEPEQGVLSFSQDAKADTSRLLFLIDQGTIKVAISDKLKNAKVEGSAADKDFKAYIGKTTRDTEEFNEFYELLKEKAKNGANRDSLEMVFQNGYSVYRKEMQKNRLSFVSANPKSFTSLILLPEIAEYSQNYNLTDSLFNSLDSKIKNSPSAKLIKDRFDNDRKLAIGSVSPDFSQPDTEGRMVKLSDFRGKYVLIDFWASWCGPCRQENPNVVKTFNQFKDKNFTVLGVSLDRSGAKPAWLKAIKDDNLTWPQVSDLNFWKNEAAVLYNVTSIPQNYLLDPEGKIIAKNLRGEDLHQALSEIFK